MPRPFTLAQAAQNRAFLERLALSGNVRLAAREVGVKYSTIQNRRSGHAGFAQEWEAVAAAVHARLHLAGGKRGPEPLAPAGAGAGERGAKGKRVDPGLRRDDGKGRRRAARSAPPPGFTRSPSPDKLGEDLRTKGGEPMVVRTRSGRLQVRLAHPDKLTKAAEQVFLRALAATCNVRLSAAAAGASVAAFNRRRRQRPAFAREWRLALRMGWERLEMAALAAGAPESHEDDAWRECEPAPIPPMSASEAIQLLYLHQKSVCLGWDLPHRRRRRGEPWETYTTRLAAMWRCEKAREAEDEAVRRALRFESSGDWRFAAEAPPPPLPPLELVTGWSRASGKPPYHEGVALFGGWRIGDMETALRRRSAGR